MFHIRAFPTAETLAFRRQRVLSRLRTRPPFTLGFLYQRLDELVGIGRWSCKVDYPAYALTIRADAEKEASRTELPYLVNQIKPAHIAFRLCLAYDPAVLSVYTAAAPCSAVMSCTVRLPGTIRPKAVSASAFAGSRLVHARETITIKIGGIT